MNKYIVHSSNIDNSLVFYRSLLDRMPDVLSPHEVIFKEPEFELAIQDSENKEDTKGPFHLHLPLQSKLKATYKRMRRFLRKNQLAANCENLDETIGLADPDGYKWIVGKYQEEVSYEKCYINF